MRLSRTSAVLAALLLGALSPAFAKKMGPPAGAWRLDPSASHLTAVAVKNHVKPVPVNFPGLKGWADPRTGKAWLRIPIATLSTGEAARDYNVRTFFFEVGKLAGYATASFRLDSVDADVAHLASGVAAHATGRGTLRLHGADVRLEGPLSFLKRDRSLTVTLDKGWAIAIDRTNLVPALHNLNHHCPQPHHVDNVVALSGTLVFRP